MSGSDWLREQAEECHRLAVARGKYRTPYPWNQAEADVIEELDEWSKELAREQSFVTRVFGVGGKPRSHQEYGDLWHVVLSVGHQMGYDIHAALADVQQIAGSL